MYQYFNPNPAGRVVGDCAVRAIAAAFATFRKTLSMRLSGSLRSTRTYTVELKCIVTYKSLCKSLMHLTQCIKNEMGTRNRGIGIPKSPYFSCLLATCYVRYIMRCLCIYAISNGSNPVASTTKTPEKSGVFQYPDLQISHSISHF